MGTLDKGLPISGNLVSFWWQAVAPALISGWTNRRFQIGLAMGNDNNNDNNNNSDYGLWRKGDAFVLFFVFFRIGRKFGLLRDQPKGQRETRESQLTTEAVIP